VSAGSRLGRGGGAQPDGGIVRGVREASGLRRGDSLEVKVEKGVYRGLGLAHHLGQVVFVPRGYPGDRLRVEVDGLTPGYVRGRILERLEDGPGRRDSPCPYVPRCGGCAYQELEAEAQRALKEAILRESLLRAGVPWDRPTPLAASPERGWRSRASLHFESREGSLRLGLHEEGRRRVVDLEECLQLSPAMNRAARGLLAELRGRGALASRLVGLDLSEAVDGSRLALALKTDMRPGEAARLASLARSVPGATGFGVEAGRGVFLSLSGEPWVESAILGLALRSHVLSFFQANRFLVEDLARTVRDLLPPGGRVLDLYAGVGLFALAAGASGREVRGAEANPHAVADAAGNAARAGLPNVRVERGDVLSLLRLWPLTGDERVILDPPRTGAGEAVVRAVLARRPEAVVYVSCDPPTLGRDLNAFRKGGYGLADLRAFDLFPDTFHLEAVALLLPAVPAPRGLC
jgi:tRNA/tmRNA/rRNA uracil-C5-methylase (TrmA/RlmC/RlmD family)